MAPSVSTLSPQKRIRPYSRMILINSLCESTGGTWVSFWKEPRSLHEQIQGKACKTVLSAWSGSPRKWPQQILKCHTDLRCHLGGPHQCCHKHHKQNPGTAQVNPEDWCQVSNGTGLQVFCWTVCQVCLRHVGPTQHQAHQDLRGRLAEGCLLDPAQILQNFKGELYMQTALNWPSLQSRHRSTRLSHLLQVPPQIDHHQ